MESVPLRKVLEWARSYDSKLLATDKRFRQWVSLYHRDGSHFLWSDAFYLKKRIKGVRGTWVLVFTEHHGCFAYDADEVQVVSLRRTF